MKTRIIVIDYPKFPRYFMIQKKVFFGLFWKTFKILDNKNYLISDLKLLFGTDIVILRKK